MAGTSSVRVKAPRRPRIRVLVVDDHRTFAEALALALGMNEDLVVHVAWSGLEALEMASRDHPEVVLMDIEMPGVDGIEIIRRIRESEPGAAVVVLSMHEEDLVKARALQAGAAGYVSKLTKLSELPDVIRRVRAGDRLIDAEEAARLSRYLRHRRQQLTTERQRIGRLTPRQVAILQLLSDGRPPEVIATELGISRSTLRTHVQNILTRMGVHSKVEAVALAIRHGKIATDA